MQWTSEMIPEAGQMGADGMEQFWPLLLWA